MRRPTTSSSEAAELLLADHELLFGEIEGLDDERLHDEYRLDDGPLGHFCDSLHDLMAHILMWDEVTLAALREAAAGRRHWSLDPRWETAAAGRSLNLGSVQAGRHIPAELLEHRLRNVLDALLAEIRGYDERAWSDGITCYGYSIGALAEYAATPPDASPYVHVVRHLTIQRPRPQVTQ